MNDERFSKIRRRLSCCFYFIFFLFLFGTIFISTKICTNIAYADTIDPWPIIKEARAADKLDVKIGLLLDLLARYPSDVAPVLHAIVLEELGGAFDDHGHFATARRFYIDALTLYRQHEAIVEQIRARTLLGRLAIRSAQFGAALDHFSAALDMASSAPEVPNEIRAELRNNLGVAYANLGDRSAAEVEFLTALALREDDLVGVATTLHNLAYARHVAGAPDVEVPYRAALAVRQTLNDPIALARTANNLGDWLTAAGRPQEAVPLLEQAVEVFARSGERLMWAHGLDSIATAWAAVGRRDAALAAYGMALAVARRNRARQLEYLVLAHLAELQIEAGNRAAAIALLKSSISVAQDIRFGLSSQTSEIRRAYASRVSDIYRRLADLLLLQDLISESERVLTLLQVHEVAEFLRTPAHVRTIPRTADEAAAMADLLSAVDQLDDVAPTKELARIRSATRPFVEAFGLLSSFLPRSGDGETPVNMSELLRYLDAVKDFDLRGDNEIEQNSKFEFVKFESSRLTKMFERFVEQRSRSDGPMSPRSIEGYKLPPNAAIIYTVLLDDRLEVILAAAASIESAAEPLLRHWVDVTPEQIAEHVTALRNTFASPHSAPAASARILHDWLIAPFTAILQHLEIRHLVVVPDGPLRLLPLSALQAPDGRWLAEHYSVSYVTEISASRRLAELRRPLSVFAGAFGETDIKIGALRFGPLAATNREVRDLAAAMPSLTAAFGADFTPDATLAAAFRHDILHLATHAIFRDDAPSQSMVLFGNGHGVTLEAMQHWRLRGVDLVVLSACETAVNAAGENRQVISFGDLVQRKGAVAIASLWRVDDGGTAAFMRRFYTHLQAPGSSVASALARAQRDFIAGREDAANGTNSGRGLVQPGTGQARPIGYRHPFYWAPFILMGLEAQF